MFRFDRRAEVSLKETRGGHLQSSTALQLEAALCLFTGKLLGTKTKQINLGFFIFKEADMPGEVVADLGLILIQYLVQNSTKPKTTPDVNLATFPFQAVSLATSSFDVLLLFNTCNQRSDYIQYLCYWLIQEVHFGRHNDSTNENEAV